MGKLVKRLMFDDIFAIGRNESWLSDMAKKGLHLKKYGRIFITFEEGEAKETNFRMDFIKEEPSQEQLDVYHDCGWDIVTKLGNIYIFSADVKLCTTELHTDPVEQGFSLSDLNKRQKSNLIIVSIAMLLFFGMTFSMFFFIDGPFLLMIEGQVVQQMLLAVAELYVFYSVIKNYVAIRKLKKSLLQGKAINHKEGYKKARLTSGILAGLFLSIALLGIYIPLVQIVKSKEYTLPVANSQLPVIMLADIEQNPKLIREQDYKGNDIDRLNRVRYNWSPLAPVQYEIDEHAMIDGEAWEDRSGKYTPSIRTRFYKLTFGGMAENLTLDLISRHVYREDTVVKAISNSELDKVYLADEGNIKQIFAYLDNQVIHVTYYGKEEIEDILPLIEEKLLNNSTPKKF